MSASYTEEAPVSAREVYQEAATQPDRKGTRHTEADSTHPHEGAVAHLPPAKLGDATPDTMILHTREALHVFNGDERKRKHGPWLLAGGRHFASALRAIWRMSGKDNPYADWLLIRLYANLVALRATIAEYTAVREAAIEALRRKGLSFGVMASANPTTVTLGFRSPYGYATAETIAEFDYYVRLTHTFVRKDRLGSTEGNAEIHALRKSLFALFLKALRWKNLLLSEALQDLCCSDFAPDADEAAGRRVAIAAQLFGKLPAGVLDGSEMPRHSWRRVQGVAGVQASMAPAARVVQEASPVTGTAVVIPMQEPRAENANDVSRETCGAPHQQQAVQWHESAVQSKLTGASDVE